MILKLSNVIQILLAHTMMDRAKQKITDDNKTSLERNKVTREIYTSSLMKMQKNSVKTNMLIEKMSEKFPAIMKQINAVKDTHKLICSTY